jgi:hypothetical protein
MRVHPEGRNKVEVRTVSVLLILSSLLENAFSDFKSERANMKDMDKFHC